MSEFIGRKTELAVLKGMLERARGGAGSVAMLVGEPGIGKTRIATEFAGAARACGAMTIWGRCFEGPAHPYAPWAEALTAYVDSAAAGRVSGLSGADTAVLAHLIPALRRTRPDIPPRCRWMSRTDGSGCSTP